MHTQITQNQYNLTERHGQLVITLNNEIIIPENDPVRLLSAQLEELEYGKLYEAYSSIGRKWAADPKVMFEVLVHGYLCGIYSSRQLEEACRKRVDFMWLLGDERVPDHSTLSRFRKRFAPEIEDLFYQYARYLEGLGETDHGTVFIDGTKLESRAGKYSFCWRKSVEKQLGKLREKTGCKTLKQAKKKLGQMSLCVEFVSGKGKRKSPEQREYEAFAELCRRWEGYDHSLCVMGQSRNSYSKTDPDATFMRMKDDHMRNGQLKPAYNVQIAVNSEYITGVGVFSNRTDYGTLIPFLRGLEHHHEARYEEITADAGYERLENYLYLESTGQMSFIKPQNHEQVKKASFKRQIGRIENMNYDEADDCYICAAGRKLSLRRECSSLVHGKIMTTAYYRCESCTDCEYRAQCCQAQDMNEPKELKLKRELWEKRAVSEANITTERGVYLRLCRSIQVEGAFALLKNDFGFRRFLTRGKRNVHTELYLLCLAFNVKKYWMKRENGRLKTHLSEICIS